MAVQIQFRRGTAAQWTAADTVLAEGEIGVELDTGKFKVGDGVTAWSSLDHAAQASTNAAIAAAQAEIASLVDSAPAALNTLNELAAALGDDPNFASSVSTSLGLKADQSSLDTHTSDSTGVHGITDTANLVYTNDARLSDSRTPTDASVTTAKLDDSAVTEAKVAPSAITNAKVSAIAAIEQSKIANLVSDLASKETPSGAQAKADAAESAANSYTDSAISSATLAQSQITNLTTDLAAKATITGSTSAASNVKGLRNITISTSTPSGGSDGDVWFRY